MPMLPPADAGPMMLPPRYAEDAIDEDADKADTLMPPPYAAADKIR